MMIQPFASPATNVPLRRVARQRVEPSRQTKLDVVVELVAALDTATIPGEHYLMDRVIDLLGQEVSRAASRMSESQRQTVMRAVAELVRQAARMVPDEVTFRARAQMLTDVLRVAS
jgi:hypothetical protein